MSIAPNETNPSRRPWPWWRCTLFGLSLLGLALSAYLGWHHLTGGSVIGCAGGGPCDQVLSSRWSAVRGVLPVSGLAAGAYLAMLVAVFFIGPNSATPDRRLAWGAMLVLVGAVAGSAIWFIIVQKWFIGAFCPYCMATHTTGLLLAALVIWQAPLQIQGDSAAPTRVLGSFPAIGLVLVGLTLAGTMAAFQLGYTPPAVYHSGVTRANDSTMPATMARPVPLVGSPDAPYVVTLLFDYKCPHCQHLHSLLEEAIRRCGGKVAFALCPAPLNNQCNPYISRNVEEFKDSCELAKLGLAVWVAKPGAFAAFDRWMFSPDEPGQLWQARNIDAATAKAVELVGHANLDAAAADPWIDRYLQASVRVYGNTVNPDQSGNAVPKLVFGPHWVTPELNDVDELVTLLHDTLGVPKP